MMPNAETHYLPDPEYLKRLIADAGTTPRFAAERIGLTGRAMRYYLTPQVEGADYRVAPYPVQYTLETLACTELSARHLGTYKNPDVVLEQVTSLAYLLEQLHLQYATPSDGTPEGMIKRGRRMHALAMSGRQLISYLLWLGFMTGDVGRNLDQRFYLAQGRKADDPVHADVAAIKAKYNP